MSNSTKRRTQAERTAASDKAIFRAAIKSIARDGPRSMTLAKVGKDAGFSGGLVSYRFGSKSNLLVATAGAILELWISKVVPPASRQLSGLECLEKMVEEYFASVEKKSDLMMAQYRLMNVSYSSYPELQPTFRNYDQRLRSIICELASETARYGSTENIVDHQEFATSLIALVRGFAVQYLIDSNAIDMNSAAENTIAFIRHSLAPVQLND